METDKDTPAAPLIRSVFEAITETARLIGAVGKTGQAHQSQGGYRYRSIDALLAAAHPAMIETGLVVTPEVVEAETVRFDGYAKPHTVTRLLIDYHVYGPGGDWLPHPVRVYAEGIDNGDKGPGKAASYALKVALGQLFAIPTEQDNEAAAVEDGGFYGGFGSESVMNEKRTQLLAASKRFEGDTRDRLRALMTDIGVLDDTGHPSTVLSLDQSSRWEKAIVAAHVDDGDEPFADNTESGDQ